MSRLLGGFKIITVHTGGDTQSTEEQRERGIVGRARQDSRW